MKTNSKGFIGYLLIGLIAIFLIFGGVYIYQKNKSVNNNQIAQMSGPNYVNIQGLNQKNPTIFQTGDTVRFTWKGCSSTDLLHIQLMYYPPSDMGDSGYRVISDSVPNNGTYDWNIQPYIKTGKYKVYINDNSGVCDKGIFSKDILSITQSIKPFATFTKPADSEDIQTGDSYTITWTSNATDTIDIGYRTPVIESNNNIHWIAKNISNSGKYTWQVPTTLKNNSYYELVIMDDKTKEIVPSEAFIFN